MQLQLVSHLLCPYVHRAAIVLAEKGVAFERTYVDLKAKPAWFTAISPRGKVPLLVADGVVLFESAAIVEFVDETQPPAWMPADPFARARQRAWVEVANDLLAAQFKALSAASADEAAAAGATVAGILARYQQALDGGELDASEPSIAGVAVAPALHRFVVTAPFVQASFLDSTPAVQAWAERVAVRPAVTSTIPVDFTERFVAYLVDRGSTAIRH